MMEHIAWRRGLLSDYRPSRADLFLLAMHERAQNHSQESAEQTNQLMVGMIGALARRR